MDDRDEISRALNGLWEAQAKLRATFETWIAHPEWTADEIADELRRIGRRGGYSWRS